ncbi:MAG: hypothetical protein ABSG69_16485, partial [Candidatus Acidiferrum sp.]
MRDHKPVRIFLLLLLSWSWLANPLASAAHPMGNFSISHYAGIRLERGFIEVRYLVDMAEIPTFQEMQATGIVAQEADPSLAPYLRKKAGLLAAGLALEVNGQLVPLQLISQNAIFPPGAGGLPTMKALFVYRAALGNLCSGSTCEAHYRDSNFAGHAGWKEIVVTADSGLNLTASSAPATDRSAQLSNYPTDLLSSPPQDLEASFSFAAVSSVAKSAPPADGILSSSTPSTVSAGNENPNRSSANISRSHASSDVPAAAAEAHEQSARATTFPEAATTTPEKNSRVSLAAAPAALRANRQATPRNRFTELVSARNLSFWFLFTAALIAAGLGALHALEPGHGKTIVAAYLVGSRGTAKHAVFLGIIVTAAHTAGVYLLGALTLYASKYIVPEQL